MNRITRHYLTIDSENGPRRIHYRRCGSGPVLLMIHQSPKSSAEYEPLMQKWAEHFTCIAPDTPGFGQSDPLAIDQPDINDYAAATLAFVEALGLKQVAAWGFHSGATNLITALKLNPDIFTCIAAGGYAVWQDGDADIFGDRYLPEFYPMAYGEHLTWLWNRILEQTWFFPWFDTSNEARYAFPHDDPERVHASIMDLLSAGEYYRAGYKAVLEANRDTPPPDADVAPCLITAFDGDPLQSHIDRLGTLPKGWSARKVKTAAEQQDESLAFMLGHTGDSAEQLPEDDNAGFLQVQTGDFNGLIHWCGSADTGKLLVHAPGRAGALCATDDCIAIDLPGHGLSDAWSGDAPQDWAIWQAVIDAAATALGATQISFEPLPNGDPDKLYPDLTPDRFGQYLTTAWQIVRAQHFYAPWYEANAEHATDFEQSDISPDRLALEHMALIRAPAAKAYHIALSQKETLP